MRIWNDFLQFTTTDGICLEYALKVSKVTYNFAYIMCRSCAKIETLAHTGCTILCTFSLGPQTPFLAADVACEKIEGIQHWTSIQNILNCTTRVKTWGNKKFRGSHGKAGWATSNREDYLVNAHSLVKGSGLHLQSLSTLQPAPRTRTGDCRAGWHSPKGWGWELILLDWMP